MLKTYTNTYMYVITIDEKRGHDVGGEQWGMYGRVWSGEREGRKVENKLKPQK